MYVSAADNNYGSIPGLVQQWAGTLDLYSMQIRASAFKGESVSVTDLLADLLALTGSATLDGLTAQGNVGCDQLLCNDVNCTDVFTGAVSCAALTATGTVAGATLSSTGAVSGSLLSITGAASVGLLSLATGITGSTLTINNTHRGAYGRHADHHRGGPRGGLEQAADFQQQRGLQQRPGAAAIPGATKTPWVSFRRPR